MRRTAKSCAYMISISMLLGCIAHEPMPDAVYGEQRETLFAEIPQALKAPSVDVFYATDRAIDASKGLLLYGRDRSASLAFGVAGVRLGRDLSWDELVAWTTTQEPGPKNIQPAVESVTELTRMPPSPYTYTLGERGELILDPATLSARKAVQKQIQNVILNRLELTERKQVFIDIHGIKDPLNDTLIHLAMAYHLYGRRGVPIAYSWPAGGAGVLRGYTRDRESGEFTIFHLKEFLRTLTAMQEIEQINITAHSRGTDIILTALRELIIETRASGNDPRTTLKVGNLVLLAPDLDIEVANQRVTAEAIKFALDRITIYINDSDKAIRVSKVLFASDRRVGGIDPAELTSAQKQELQKTSNVDVIFYSGDKGGFLGHSYYRAPVILADMFLLFDGKLPGASNGRPLEWLGNSMWAIDDDYLGKRGR